MRRNTLILLLGLAVVSIPPTSVAKTPNGAIPIQRSCWGTNISTAETADCLKKVLEDREHRLQETLKMANEEAKGYDEFEETENTGWRLHHVEKLRIAQQSWRSYIDTECDAETALWTSGTGAKNADYSCRIDLTEKRIRQLKLVYLQKGH